MPAPRPRSPARAWAAARCSSPTASRPWARCRATRRSAASARDTSSRKSTRWAAPWPRRRTRRAYSFACSIRARDRRCAQRARRPIACCTGSAIRSRLENQPGLQIFQQAVDDLLLDGDRVVGRRDPDRAQVLRARGRAHHGHVSRGPRSTSGLENYQAGRAGDPPAATLAQRLRELKLPVGRLKTGTPPRIDGRSIDFSVMTEQPGDEPTPVFSFLGRARAASAAGAVLDHAHQRAHPRHHPRAGSIARRSTPA